MHTTRIDRPKARVDARGLLKSAREKIVEPLCRVSRDIDKRLRFLKARMQADN